MMYILLFCAILVTLVKPEGLYDISIYDNPNASTWECLQSYNNASTIIVEIWNGGKHIGPTVLQNVQNAQKYGFKVDLYGFFCPLCNQNNPPSLAFTQIMSYVQANNISFGKFWIDYEPCTGCFPDDEENNLNYLIQTIQTAQSLGLDIGIYTYKNGYLNLTGDLTDPVVYNSPLWYAHYDGNRDFNDSSFYTFAGWTKPAMKQIAGLAQICGMKVDESWRPDSTEQHLSESN